jgi:hypothetical protein
MAMVAVGEMATVGTGAGHGVAPGTEALTTIVAMDRDPIPMIHMVQAMDPIPVAHMVEAMGTNPIPVADMIEAMDPGLILMVDMVSPIAVMVEDGTTSRGAGR